MKNNNTFLKISSKTNSNDIAGAIAGYVEAENRVELQAVGAGAVNQAIKGIAIARGFVEPLGYDLICIPSFKSIIIEGNERTAIKFVVLKNRR